MKQNWLDRAIGFFDPQAGAARLASRARIEIMQEAQRAYDGAKVSRHTEGWFAPSSSGNAEIGAAQVRLRDRMRELRRNNPWVAHAIRIIAGNAVGYGIMPSFDSDAVADLWDEWVLRCDASGDSDYYGLQYLDCTAMAESGGVLTRFRPRYPDDGLPVALQLQQLEIDFIDLAKTEMVNRDGQRRILQGIEFDALDQRAQYWLFRNHPGDAAGLGTDLQSRPVSARDIVHLFRKDRPGQIHGVPFGASGMTTLWNLGNYEEAELIKQKLAACFGLVFEKAAASDAPPVLAATGSSETVSSGAAAGARKDIVEPGMVISTNPGEKLVQVTPPNSTTFDLTTRYYLRKIAQAFDITYEQLTGDLSNVNYSSYRAGHNEMRRGIETLQWNVLIPRERQKMERFLWTARMEGKIPRDLQVRVEWTPPPFQSVDPEKEAVADLLEMRMGLVTHKEKVAARGYNYRKHMLQLYKEAAERTQNGIVLDIDARYVSRAGVTQARGNTSDFPEPNEPSPPAA